MKRDVRRGEVFHFSSLRTDWYRSNQTLPRAIRHAVNKTRRYSFEGFPRQWIPIFAWFDVPWTKSIAPSEYLPFFSDLNEQKLRAVVRKASKERMLRSMVEAAATLDPVISDCLYILDHTVKRVDSRRCDDCAREPSQARKNILLTSWQAYGRPSVLSLERAVMNLPTRSGGAVILPCSFKRPYNESPTHRRISSQLQKRGYDVRKLHKIVLTSLGVIPEELWDAPAVMRYDAGVPDIYRLLRLLRTFFSVRSYDYIVDCSQFPPYSDLLRIIQREGLITDLRRVNITKRFAFYVRHPKRVAFSEAIHRRPGSARAVLKQ
jgi:hypothetical protein